MNQVFIIDDHAMVRAGLKQIVATTNDIEVIGEASNGTQALSIVCDMNADVCMLDLGMPGLSGMDLIGKLRQVKPELPVLVLSMHNSVHIVEQSLEAGASGYVTKDSEPEILLRAIRRIAGGGKFVDPSLVDELLIHQSSINSKPSLRLTGRELQILKGISSGLALGDIATELHLSPKTVSTYKKRLMQKLGTENNAELIRYGTKIFGSST